MPDRRCRDGGRCWPRSIDPPSRAAVETERAFLAELGSGCSLPVGAHAAGDLLSGFLADPATGRALRRRVDLGADRVAAARRLARDLASELAADAGT